MDRESTVKNLVSCACIPAFLHFRLRLCVFGLLANVCCSVLFAFPRVFACQCVLGCEPVACCVVCIPRVLIGLRTCVARVVVGYLLPGDQGRDQADSAGPRRCKVKATQLILLIGSALLSCVLLRLTVSTTGLKKEFKPRVQTHTLFVCGVAEEFLSASLSVCPQLNPKVNKAAWEKDGTLACAVRLWLLPPHSLCC